MTKIKNIMMGWLEKNWHIILALVVFVLSFFGAFGMYGVPELWKNIFVVVISAAATYVIVAILNSVQQKQQKEQIEFQEKQRQEQVRFQTEQQQRQAEFQEEQQKKQSELQMNYLKKQDETSREREKSIQIHQSKLAAFSKFIGNIWDVNAKNTDYDGQGIKISNLLKTIRSQMFHDVIFHISPQGLKEINVIVEKNTKNPVALCSGITRVIKSELDDIRKDQETIAVSGEAYETELRSLWSTMQERIVEAPCAPTKEFQSAHTDISGVPNDVIINDKESQTEILSSTKVVISDYGYNQAWHFALWGVEQISAISKWQADGRSSVDLSLVEYGETWRTNLLKQVDDGDIVFLFRRGGYGYIGAFKPLGWRVFDFNENIETIHLFYKEEEIVKGDRFELDVKEFDIYGSRDDGADLCANLIVEIVAYQESGVDNPGGVYRRTISRYDSQYAAKLMERFKPYMINDK